MMNVNSLTRRLPGWMPAALVLALGMVFPAIPDARSASDVPSCHLGAGKGTVMTADPRGRQDAAAWLATAAAGSPSILLHGQPPPETVPSCPPGEGMMIVCWVRLDGPEILAKRAALSVRIRGAEGQETVRELANVPVSGGRWTRLAGWFYRPKSRRAELLSIAVVGAAGIPLLIDDAVIWRTDAATPEDARAPLRVVGRELREGEGGAAISLHGVNLHAYSDDEQAADDVQHALSSAGEEDYADIAAAGFNVVRLNLWHKPFRLAMAGGWRWLDLHRNWARRHGLRLIIDLHAPPGGYQGPNYCGNFWKKGAATDKLREQALRFWAKAAIRYRDDPTVAAFDLINEPCPPEDDQWWDFAGQAVAAIRGQGCHLPIIVESPIRSGDLVKLADPGIIYDVHFYEPWDFAGRGQGQYGTACIPGESGVILDKTWLARQLDDYLLDFAARHQVPVNVGEYGVTPAAVGGEDWVADVLCLLTEHRVHRQYWCWMTFTFGLERDGWHRFHPHDRNEALLAILAPDPP